MAPHQFRFEIVQQPIVEDDAFIRAALNDGPLPSLLAAVAHQTGDLSVLRPEWRPDLARVLEPNLGLSDNVVAAARDAAAQALCSYRDGGSRPASLGTADIAQIVDFLAGGRADPAMVPLFREELAIDGEDLRAPTWHVDEVAPGAAFTVGIVGSGMSGIAAAHRLRQAGVQVVIWEKNTDVGGTWFENTYPGCRVDVPTHFYSYSFAQTEDWPQFFSRQPVLQEYFAACVDRFGLRSCIEFDTEVLDAAWDESGQQWTVTTRTRAGEQHRTVHALVSATGQLNRPLMPNIDGMADFAGPSFHSAHWDHGVDLNGKRVAVIGTGASAVQFVPHVVAQSAHVTVFQRTPPWLLPVETYQSDVPASLRWLGTRLPQYVRWDRLWMVVRTQEGLLPYADVDPQWSNGGESVGPMNEMLRQLLLMALEMSVPDAELRAKLTPHYPPAAKRIVFDNGAYIAALQQPNVAVETASIDAITSRGVRTDDGVEHDADVIIYGTGFAASEFLTPMRVTGVGGLDLHERWGGDARAYLGITVPKFPNLFLMYGPNTNIVINGSIIYFSECEANYIVESVRYLLENDATSIDCRESVHNAYNEQIDAGNRKRAWGAATVNSWYRNRHGRVAQNWPFNLIRYWEQTRALNPADYHIINAKTGSRT
jgi:4-hydroxyacetophenone monooxygenase